MFGLEKLVADLKKTAGVKTVEKVAPGAGDDACKQRADFPDSPQLRHRFGGMRPADKGEKLRQARRHLEPRRRLNHSRTEARGKCGNHGGRHRGNCVAHNARQNQKGRSAHARAARSCGAADDGLFRGRLERRARLPAANARTLRTRRRHARSRAAPRRPTPTARKPPAKSRKNFPSQ